LIDALTAAGNSMNNDMTRLNVISNNLANSVTSGFKKQILVSRPFTEFLGLVDGAGGQVPYQVSLPIVDSVTDFNQGTLKNTGNPLDLAAVDNGFFEVMTEQGPAYTRQGNFKLDPRGRLVTEAGFAVTGTTGELTLTSPNPVIDKDGNVFENEKQIGQIRLVRFNDPSSLDQIGHGLYRLGPNSTIKIDESNRMRQGFLEMSNVTSMTEMVKMIETMRHFETAQRIVQGYDEMLDKAITKLGEF
jgi:flagellar basal-body rod protein FlgF